MADTTTSPNMSLSIPVVGQESGPQWATDLNNCLTTIDSHDHTPGRGVPVPTAGININADLSMLDNNLINIRTLRFQSQSAVSGVADIGCLYEIANDLYFTDGTGRQIRITQSGSVSGASGTITGLPSGTASASYDSIGGTFVFQSATNVAANIDAGSLFIRNTSPNSTNAVTLQAPAALAANYALTLPPLPAQTNVMTLSSSGVIDSITYDAVGQGMSSVGANAIGTVMTASGANAVANSRTRATGSTVGAGGVAISSSSGTGQFNASSAFADITGMSVTITTTGRPVWVGYMSDGTSNNGAIGSDNPGQAQTTGQFAIVRGTTVVGRYNLETSAVSGAPAVSIQVPSTAVAYVDVVGAGTYTYKAQFKTSGPTGSEASIFNTVLVAYEL